MLLKQYKMKIKSRYIYLSISILSTRHLLVRYQSQFLRLRYVTAVNSTCGMIVT